MDGEGSGGEGGEWGLGTPCPSPHYELCCNQCVLSIKCDS